MQVEMARNRGLTFILNCFSNFGIQLFHDTTDIDPRIGSISWL